MKIALHIERLVVDGLPVSSAQGARLQHAVERRLAHLLADGGIPRESSAVASVQALQIRFGRGERVEELGKRVAAATYRSLGGSSKQEQR